MPPATVMLTTLPYAQRMMDIRAGSLAIRAGQNLCAPAYSHSLVVGRGLPPAIWGRCRGLSTELRSTASHVATRFIWTIALQLPGAPKPRQSR